MATRKSARFTAPRPANLPAADLAIDARSLVIAATDLNAASADQEPIAQVLEAAETKLDALVERLSAAEAEQDGAEPTATAIASAKAELHRQLEQTYALVTGARDQIRQWQQHNTGRGDLDVALNLLDLAQDELADREYLNRIAGGAA